MIECVARYENKIIFTYHYADRRDVMRQSMLSKVTTHPRYTFSISAPIYTFSRTTLHTPFHTSFHTPP